MKDKILEYKTNDEIREKIVYCNKNIKIFRILFIVFAGLIIITSITNQIINLVMFGVLIIMLNQEMNSYCSAIRDYKMRLEVREIEKMILNIMDGEKRKCKKLK